MFLYLLRLNKFKIKTILFAREKIQPCFIGPCASLVPHLPYVPIISKKLTIKIIISVHHVGDNEVRGVKAAINKIVQSFSQKSFKGTYMIYNL